MGREVKRVPLDFNWPIKRVWFGFRLAPIFCQLCKVESGPLRCSLCYGEKEVYPRLDIPTGDGYQMWETTSEGSPISPVFQTPEDLAKWLAESGASAFGDMTATYDQWLGMIREGFAPSMVMADKLVSGVEAVSKMKKIPSCVVCHIVPVDVDNGYDTCSECAART